MWQTYFDNTQLILLLAGSSCLFFSIFLDLREKEKFSILFLALSALFIYFFAALLDPFLNIWDERFHALVAKNLMHHPLMPTLYDNPVVDIAYNTWDKYHIWLHKQPLFLWQIALSFKIFGVNEFALRLPSAVLASVMVIIGYRSGKLLVNKNVGYYTAILLVSSFYIIEMVAGRQELDHNDLSFMVYISLSIWAWIEYTYTSNKIWLILIGVFSGFAILCKWLVGLLVYLGWAVFIFQSWKFKILKYKDLFIALAITILIALPWQLLIFKWYPAEATIAYGFNVNHFIKPLEGHDGSMWYHLDMLNQMYGKIVPFFIIPAFILFRKKINNSKIFNSLLIMVLVVYLFFSFAETKMPSFTIVTALIIYIALACFIDYLFDKIRNIKISQSLINSFIFIFLFFLVLIRFDVELLQEKHTLWKEDNTYTRMLSYNRTIFQNLKFPPNTVLFNVRGRHYIEAMFYSDYTAYNFYPSADQCNDLKKKGNSIAIFKPLDNKLDTNLLKDPNIIIINEVLQGYD